MKYNIISSGSKGNCIVVDNIMCDCGVPYSKIKDILHNVKLMFISHKHTDHLNKATIKKIAYEYPSIKFVVGHYLVEQLIELGVKKQNILCLEIEKWYNLGICKARLDYLTHDVPNNCIHIELSNGEKLLYATDTATLDNVIAKNYDMYFIEANYETKEELEQRIKEDKEQGKFSHYERVLETHLSQLDAINWLDNNKGEKINYIFIHQHEDKND